MAVWSGQRCKGLTSKSNAVMAGQQLVCEAFVRLLLPPPRRLRVHTLSVGSFVGRLVSRGPGWRMCLQN